MTALAAVQKLEGKGNIMGISMGSSEGAGYANAEGLSLRILYEIHSKSYRMCAVCRGLFS